MSTGLIDESRLVKKGQFYKIYELDDEFMLLDKTKRGLTISERSYDPKYECDVDKGFIFDMDGKRHKVSICWHFPKSKFTLDRVLESAIEMEEYYKKLREETCPDKYLG
ncbi:MAG: hypothetical protein QW416_07710 [Candidatus Nitrosocaldaceae archaeon]